jgi:hypothetical protein
VELWPSVPFPSLADYFLGGPAAHSELQTALNETVKVSSLVIDSTGMVSNVEL